MVKKENKKMKEFIQNEIDTISNDNCMDYNIE